MCPFLTNPGKNVTGIKVTEKKSGKNPNPLNKLIVTFSCDFFTGHHSHIPPENFSVYVTVNMHNPGIMDNNWLLSIIPGDIGEW